MEQSQGNSETTTNASGKPIKVGLARLLALLNGIFGYNYCGLPRPLFVFTLCYGLVIICFAWFRWLSTFNGLLSLLTIEIGFRIFAVIDVGRKAREINEGKRVAQMTVMQKSVVVIGVLAIGYFSSHQKLLGYQSFRIPSTGNAPTLQVDDCVVADIHYYNNCDPACGDMVVYLAADGFPYCSRVIGLPGDRIRIVGDVPFINGQAAGETLSGDTVEFDVGKIHRYVENLPGNVSHKIFIQENKLAQVKDTTEEIFIPDGMYYLLSDNRDNSLDSRYRGPVFRSDIIGKVLYTYWGSDQSRINVQIR